MVLSKDGVYKDIDAYLARQGIALPDGFWQQRGDYADILARYTSDGVRTHLSCRILPTAALYRVLQQQGMDKAAAKALLEDYVFDETEKATASLKTLGKLPFFFSLFRSVLKKRLPAIYPDEGWRKTWVADSADEVAFNMDSCLYLEIFTQLGVPELCDIFCRVDEISYGDISRRLSFERTETLAKRNPRCDFRFVRRRP